MERVLEFKSGESLELGLLQSARVPGGIGNYASSIAYGGTPNSRTFSLGLFYESHFSPGLVFQFSRFQRCIPTNEGELTIEEVTKEHMILKYIKRSKE